MAVFFLTALFRAAGLAVALLPALPHVGIALELDGLLLGALAVLAVVSAVTRGLVRRHKMGSRGMGMALALCLLAVAMSVCIQRTGGLFSPLILMLGVLVAVGALVLSPIANFFSLSCVCLLQTVMVMGTAEGILPREIFGPHEPAPFSLLMVVLGLLGLLGLTCNGLAWHLRVQQAELACRDLHDPLTGTLRRSFFHARLVSMLEDRRGHEGVALILLDVGGERALRDAGDLLLETVRGDDLAGRVGETRFAVAVAARTEEAGPQVARRLVERLERLGVQGVAAGHAYRDASALGGEPADTARELYRDAEASLANERVGFAA